MENVQLLTTSPWVGVFIFGRGFTLRHYMLLVLFMLGFTLSCCGTALGVQYQGEPLKEGEYYFQPNDDGTYTEFEGGPANTIREGWTYTAEEVYVNLENLNDALQNQFDAAVHSGMPEVMANKVAPEIEPYDSEPRGLVQVQTDAVEVARADSDLPPTADAAIAAGEETGVGLLGGTVLGVSSFSVGWEIGKGIDEIFGMCSESIGEVLGISGGSECGHEQTHQSPSEEANLTLRHAVSGAGVEIGSICHSGGTSFIHGGHEIYSGGKYGQEFPQTNGICVSVNIESAYEHNTCRRTGPEYAPVYHCPEIESYKGEEYEWKGGFGAQLSPCNQSTKGEVSPYEVGVPLGYILYSPFPESTCPAFETYGEANEEQMPATRDYSKEEFETAQKDHLKPNEYGHTAIPEKCHEGLCEPQEHEPLTVPEHFPNKSNPEIATPPEEKRKKPTLPIPPPLIVETFPPGVSGQPLPRPTQIEIPLPKPGETGTEYTTKLKEAGVKDTTLETIPDDEADPEKGPEGVVTVTPDPGSQVEPETPVDVKQNPPSAPQVEPPKIGGPTLPGFKFPNFGVLCKGFPFGVPCWLAETVSSWSTTAVAPEWGFENLKIDGHTINAKFKLSQLESIMEVVRPAMVAFATIGLVLLFYNFAKGGTPPSGGGGDSGGGSSLGVGASPDEDTYL